jgi:hypothetical protein
MNYYFFVEDVVHHPKIKAPLKYFFSERPYSPSNLIILVQCKQEA